MKRVVLTIPTLSGGGAERVVSIWAEQLVRLGFDVSVLISGHDINEYAVHPDIRVYSIAETYSEYDKLSVLKKIILRRKLIRSINPDYIVSFLQHIQIQTYLATFRLPVKRIETVRVNPWIAEPRNRIKRYLWKRCFGTCCKILLQTKEQEEYFDVALHDKCVIIPNPIDATCLRKYRQTFSDAAFRFIAAGRLSPQKNYPLMIDAFSQICREHPEAKLSIYGVGEASYVEKLSMHIKCCGLENNVRLMGRSNSMADEYVKNDVFVMASRFEGMPNALAEAMACQLTCISSDCKTGPRDLIDNGVSGLLVPANDTESLVEAMRTAMRMTKQQRLIMGRNARQKVLELCSEENSCKSLAKLFE